MNEAEKKKNRGKFYYVFSGNSLINKVRVGAIVLLVLLILSVIYFLYSLVLLIMGEEYFNLTDYILKLFDVKLEDLEIFDWEIGVWLAHILNIILSLILVVIFAFILIILQIKKKASALYGKVKQRGIEKGEVHYQYVFDNDLERKLFYSPFLIALIVIIILIINIIVSAIFIEGDALMIGLFINSLVSLNASVYMILLLLGKKKDQEELLEKSNKINKMKISTRYIIVGLLLANSVVSFIVVKLVLLPDDITFGLLINIIISSVVITILIIVIIKRVKKVENIFSYLKESQKKD